MTGVACTDSRRLGDHYRRDQGAVASMRATPRTRPWSPGCSPICSSAGLDTSGGTLVVVDGAKSLTKAVRKMFGGQAPIQRCTVHKRRNAARRAQPGVRVWPPRPRARRLTDRTHPSVTAGIREGLEECSPSAGSGCPPASSDADHDEPGRERARSSSRELPSATSSAGRTRRCPGAGPPPKCSSVTVQQD